MSDFLVLGAYLTTTLDIHKDEHEEKRKQRDWRSTCWGQVPLQAPTARMEMHVNLPGLTDVEVRTTLV